MAEENKKPRVLVFDIETYGGLKAHMSEISVFGYKWFKEGKTAQIISGLDFPAEFKKNFTNDAPLLKALSKVWNEADAVIAHYGERFDRRFINSRLEKHGLPPLKPVVLIDTWRLSKDHLALHGNRLDTLQQFFGSPYQKIGLSYEEWRQVMRGDVPALKKLIDHCVNDVLGLEYIFEHHLIHYTNKMPNWNLYVTEKVCPQCGSKDIVKNGLRYTQTAVWQRYFCKKCHVWSLGSLKGGKVR